MSNPPEPTSRMTDESAELLAVVWKSLGPKQADHQHAKLIRYVETWQDRNAWLARVDADGPMIEGLHGLRTHPLLSEIKAANATLGQLEKALGMSIDSLPDGIENSALDAISEALDGRKKR